MNVKMAKPKAKSDDDDVKKNKPENVDLLKNIHETDAISATTKKNYDMRCSAILNKVTQNSGVTPLLTIVQNPNTYIPLFREWYPKDTSYKVYLSCILGLFRYNKSFLKALDEEQEVWLKAFTVADEAVDKRYETNTPTDRQKEGYVPFAKIVTERGLQAKGSIARVLLGMYTDLRPMRCEYARVALYKDETDLPPEPEANYILLNPGRLIIATFKTRKHHDAYNIDIPKTLLDDIKESLKHHKRDYLFVNAKGEPYSQSLFSEWTMREFKRMFGKPLSVALIRHSYINTLDFNKLSIEEKREIATAMGHTVATQDRYRLLFDRH